MSLMSNTDFCEICSEPLSASEPRELVHIMGGVGYAHPACIAGMKNGKAAEPAEFTDDDAQRRIEELTVSAWNHSRMNPAEVEFSEMTEVFRVRMFGFANALVLMLAQERRS